MTAFETGKSPTERRQFRCDSIWYWRGYATRIEKDLAKLMLSGIVPRDEDWWATQTHASSLRPSTNDVIPIQKPPQT
jgi:hypothetical protein